MILLLSILGQASYVVCPFALISATYGRLVEVWRESKFCPYSAAEKNRQAVVMTAVVIMVATALATTAAIMVMIVMMMMMTAATSPLC